MRIINFGSLNQDYVYAVDHFVKPGETVRSESLDVLAGGKGLNQSIAAARAGAQVMHAGKIGSDGTNLADHLRRDGINVDFIEQSKHKSGHAIIQVDQSGQNSILLYSGANRDVDCEAVDRVVASLDGDDILLIQNEISNIAYIMKRAHDRGIRIAFNPSPITAEVREYPLEYVTWLILNEIEGEELSGMKEPDEIAKELRKRYGVSSVVLTLGKNGVLYMDAGKTARHGVYSVERVDTTGAGDAFTGYFLAGITRGEDIEKILRIASIASSISVSRNGASPSIPTLSEVLHSKLQPEI